MARVKHVKKARASKRPRICLLCPHEVQVGEPYKYIAKKTGPRSSQTLVFCKDCNPRPSHSLSGRSAEWASIRESFDDDKGSDPSPEQMRDALDGYGSSMNEFAEEISEAAQAIEDGFEHPTMQSEAMSGTADEFQDLASRIEYHVNEFPEDHPGEMDDWMSEAESLADEEPDLNLQG